MKRWFKTPDVVDAALNGVTLLYPFLALLLLNRLGPYPMLLLVGALAVLRLALPAARLLSTDLVLAPLIVAAVAGAVATWDAELALRLYPVLMNLVLLHIFARSLWTGPSMIERFARLHEPDLDAQGVRYTRTVTMVWVGFFALNGIVALCLALFGSWLAWASYTGGIAYLLAGLLLAGEYLVRGWVRRRHDPAIG